MSAAALSTAAALSLQAAPAAAAPAQPTPPRPPPPPLAAAAAAVAAGPSASDVYVVPSAKPKVHARVGSSVVDVFGQHTYHIRDALKALSMSWDADVGRRCWTTVVADTTAFLSDLQRTCGTLGFDLAVEDE